MKGASAGNLLPEPKAETSSPLKLCKEDQIDQCKIDYSAENLKKESTYTTISSYIPPTSSVTSYSNEPNQNHQRIGNSRSFGNTQPVNIIFGEADSSSSHQLSELSVNYPKPDSGHLFHRGSAYETIGNYSSYMPSVTSTSKAPAAGTSYSQRDAVNPHSMAVRDNKVLSLVIKIANNIHSPAQQHSNVAVVIPTMPLTQLPGPNHQYQVNISPHQPQGYYQPQLGSGFPNYQINNYQPISGADIRYANPPFPPNFDNQTLNPANSVSANPDSMQSPEDKTPALTKRPCRGQGRKIKLGQKDEKYWERRRRNNLAAKRSRDAKRMSENCLIEALNKALVQNSILRGEITDLRKRAEILENLYSSFPA